MPTRKTLAIVLAPALVVGAIAAALSVATGAVGHPAFLSRKPAARPAAVAAGSPSVTGSPVEAADSAAASPESPGETGSTAPVSPASPVPDSALDRLAGPAAAGDLDVMTFNLRYASTSRPNSWAQRRPAMRALLATEHPDLIGTQEGLTAQLADIKSDLAGRYEYVGVGREGGTRGEYVAIFYDPARLTSRQVGNFWLSDTPEVPGSNTWGGGSIRMVTWVRFLDRATGGQFYAVNTHLDNTSGSARERAATLIGNRLAGFTPRLPIVLTGDFNSPAGESNPVYRRLTSEAGYRDTWLTAARRGPVYGTFTDFAAPAAGGDRIDWILANGGTTAKATLINTFRLSGQYPSDHLPVEARLRLPATA